MIRFLQILSVSLYLAGALGSEPVLSNDDQRSILVTGASSGIGRHLAETLSGAGLTSTPVPAKTPIWPNSTPSTTSLPCVWTSPNRTRSMPWWR